MTAQPTSKSVRTFKGFVALERSGGPILWGTLRPSAEEARAQFMRWNPLQAPVIVDVRLTVSLLPLTVS